MTRFSLGTRKQAYLWALLAVVLVLAVVRWKSRAEPVAQTAARTTIDGEAEEAQAPATAARTGGGRLRTTASPDEVGVLDPKFFEPRQSAETHVITDIFSGVAPTPTPPPPPTPAPPPAPVCGHPLFLGPCPPPAPTPTPPPPEIPFKFIGTFGPKERPVAVLLLGDQIVNARSGEVVFDRFILRKVGYESIDVGFVGRDPAELRRLAIAP